MFKAFSAWYKRYFADPEAFILLATLVVFCVIFTTMGHMLAPVFVSVVIAYLLDGSVRRLEQWKFPHLLAVSIMCLVFLGLVLVSLVWLLPMLSQQLTTLFNELPNTITSGQTFLMRLPQKYPDFISADQVNHLTTSFKSELGNVGKVIISFFVASIPGIIEVIVYAVLVPLLVFFFLKDRDQILAWLSRFLPKKRNVIRQVWNEVNEQIGNYIRGRIIEVFLVGIISGVVFKIMGLNYAVLLGALVGISAIVPYIGAIVSTIPIVIIGLLQWGLSAHFAYLMIVYTVISLLDSNVLVPLLFSETMKLHPVAIIVAVIVFGGLFGFWGVFFAIPLATVVKAVITHWPKTK